MSKPHSNEESNRPFQLFNVEELDILYYALERFRRCQQDALDTTNQTMKLFGNPLAESLIVFRDGCIRQKDIADSLRKTLLIEYRYRL